jgi:site-specific DNA-methyltransferase (adenine-specific)
MSMSDEWETPPWLWNQLDEIFNFDFDACCTPKNMLAESFGDALGVWPLGNVFMNPPYSKPKKFLEAAYKASLEGTTVVCLLKGDPSTTWWNEWVKDKATVMWIPKRVRFYLNRLPGPHVANFPSVIAIYWGSQAWTV